MAQDHENPLADVEATKSNKTLSHGSYQEMVSNKPERKKTKNNTINVHMLVIITIRSGYIIEG